MCDPPASVRLQLKMPGLTDYQRKRIVSLLIGSHSKLEWTQIVRILATEGVNTTRYTVRNTITRWQKTGSILDHPRSGPLKKVPDNHIQCIDELTAPDLLDILTQTYGAENIQYRI